MTVLPEEWLPRIVWLSETLLRQTNPGYPAALVRRSRCAT